MDAPASKTAPSSGHPIDGAPTAPHPPPAIPDYTLLRPIGRGSYGDVWLARGITGSLRAIKIVWRDRFADDAPFEREFHGLRESVEMSLQERFQLAVLHVGRHDEAGFFYYVMELADDAERGRTIEPATYVPLTLSEARARHGRLPPATCLAYAIPLARELAFLHGRGLVHRDIKASNVILVDGLPKLADIGLVTRTRDAHTFVGTEGFVPPEGPGSPRADVYALGKLLYELLTGFDRNQFPRLPSGLAQLPDHRELLRLNAIVLRACDPFPSRRYADGQALLTDLLRLHAELDSKGTASDDVPHSASRSRRLRIAFASLIALIAVTGAWFALHRLPSLASSIRPSPKAESFESSKSPFATATPSIPLPSPILPPLENALVVLPLHAPGTDAALTAFADDLHTELILTLQRIPELRVISRQSAHSLRETVLPLAEIGRQLGVGIAVTGTLRRIDSDIRIQLELRHIATEQLIWSRLYRSDLRNTFALQCDISEEVSRVLAARSASSAEARVRILTRDARAFDLYIKGIASEFEVGPKRREVIEACIEHLRQALVIDPSFVAANNALSYHHALLARVYLSDPGEKLRHAAEALRLAERAAQIMPGDSGNGALIYYYANIEQNYPRALELSERYLKIWPHLPAAHECIAMSLGGMGRLAEAEQWWRRSIKLDPRVLSTRLSHLRILCLLRRKEAWQQALNDFQAIAKPADLLHEFVPRSRLALFGEPPTESLLRELEMPLRREFLWQGRRFAELLSLVDVALASASLNDANRFHLLCQRSDVLRHLNRPGEADASAGEAFAIARRLHDIPELDPSDKHLRSAKVLVRLGRADEALDAGRRYVEAMRAGDQQMPRWSREILLAALAAQAARTRVSIDLLERLLREPSGLTVPMLRTDPVWDPLRGDARFKTLLADPKNHAPL